MYTPRYLSQFNQAALVARLEALESEVAALNRAPREKRGPVSPAPAVIDALRKAERAEKRQTDIDRALKEAFEREAVRNRATRTPFEEHWERRYGPQPTLMGLPVGTPGETLRVERDIRLGFAPGTPSKVTTRLPEGVRIGNALFNGEAVRSPFLRDAAALGIFDQALRNRGMGTLLRDATTVVTGTASWREKDPSEIVSDMLRAKEAIRSQVAQDVEHDCMGYLTKAMYQRLDPSATSQEIKRPVQVKITGRRADFVVMDEYDVSERLEKFAEPLQDDKPTPAELDAIRQSIMDSAKAQKERK